MMIVPIQQEDGTTGNVYAPNARMSGHLSQNLMDPKGEIGFNTIMMAAG